MSCIVRTFILICSLFHKASFFSYNIIPAIMSNDKSLSMGENSFTGNKTSTMGITSRQKFENMEKLSTMVREMQQNSSRPAHPQQILEAIKNNIKSNYNKLYDNYEANRNAILKNIQQTEMNDANEGSMKQKFQSVLKEKNAYDRLKVEVEKKQKKLKKLMEIHEQTLTLTASRQQLKDTLAHRNELIKCFEEHKGVLDYESAVLQGMKRQRELIKLNLKQRHENMLEEEQIKRERTKRMADAAHTKKVILDQIEEKIRQEDLCEIPLPLSEELERKLEQYEGRYTQQNILLHQKILSEQKSKREKSLLEQELDTLRKTKQAKQQQQKRELQIAYSHFLLKQAEQQQIKKFCRVDSITEIANGSVQEEKESLMKVKEAIEKQIELLAKENKKVRGEIQVVMTTAEQGRKDQGVNFLQLEEELQNEETQARRIKAHALKKENVMVQWQAVLQAMFPGKNNRNALLQKFRKSIPKYESLSIRDHVEVTTAPETAEMKNTRANFNLKYKKMVQRANNESSQASSSLQI